MKKYSAVSNILLAISLTVTGVAIKNAYANETYYIEIGTPSTAEETQEQWKQLSTKYKSTLGKLNFYPKSSVNSQGESTNTIQAGPVNDKNRAQKICNNLFSKNIPCFVIEGIEKAPPTVSMAMGRSTNIQPVPRSLIPQEDLNRDIGATQQVAEAESITIQETPQPKASRDAEVDVAQAIPVPLSDRNEIQNIEVEVREEYQEKSRNASLVSFPSPRPGRLIIESFANEVEANKFWKNINEQNSDLTSGLSVRVQRPLMVSRNVKVQLNVGIFDNGDAAANFCNSTVGNSELNLQCRYEVTKETIAASNLPVEERLSSENTIHANAYETRRRLIHRKIPAGQRDLYRKLPTAEDVTKIDGKKYWVQVVIADSKSEAKRRLAEIKKVNEDVIGDAGSSILYSPTAHAKYTVRIGSFTEENDANKLCDNLQLRGVDCLLITTADQ